MYVYHGTSKEAYSTILETGVLQPSKPKDMLSDLVLRRGTKSVIYYAKDFSIARSFAGRSGKILRFQEPSDGFRLGPEWNEYYSYTPINVNNISVYTGQLLAHNQVSDDPYNESNWKAVMPTNLDGFPDALSCTDKKCYQFAINMAKSNMLIQDFFVVHGILHPRWRNPIKYAWVIVGDLAYEVSSEHPYTIELFYELYKPTDEHFYQASKAVSNALATGSYGPWI